MKSKNQAKNTKIVFFGAGQTSLEALQCLNEDFDISLVITKPPATNSSGKKFTNPLHLWAQQNNIEVLTPDTKTEMTDLLKHKDFSDCLGVVLDFGMIIPADVIDLFPKGILNSHFSLLPLYRGSNPIRAAILSGDKTTGVTIIKITPGLDDGPILSWAEQEINNYNALELRNKLSEINCALLVETIRLYLNEELEPVAQDESLATHTSKTAKDDGLLNPNKTALQLEREIRAYAGWPKSFINYKSSPLIFVEAKASSKKVPEGKLKALEGQLYFGCKNGSLLIKRLQPAGKAVMDAKSFINGYLK